MPRSLTDSYVCKNRRGALFGPVVAAAVLMNPDADIHPKLNDSKKMTSRNRMIVRDYIQDNLLFGLGIVSPKTIDDVNILNATFTAMHIAIGQIPIDPDQIIVDGDRFRPYRINDQPIPFTTITGGDGKFASIAYASVLAKTERDNIVLNYVQSDPTLESRYRMSQHKGYPTPDHIEGIRAHGLHENHRKTFKIKNL